jgi:hypothetical protein
MRYLLTITICFPTLVCFAQQKQNRFILIIRSKSHINASPEKIKNNIGHWTEWMTYLGKNGKISGGYRPENERITISGEDKTIKIHISRMASRLVLFSSLMPQI